MHEETKKRLWDREWRIDNLYYITNKDGLLVPYKRNYYQKRFDAERHGRDIILKTRQLWFCLDPSTLVLTANLQWEKIKDLEIWTEIIAVDENSPGSRGSSRKMRTAIVKNKVIVHRKAYKISFDDGRYVICTWQHPWLSRKKNTQLQWRAIEIREWLPGKLNIWTQVRWITKPWRESNFEDWWFWGMLDWEWSIRSEKVSAGLTVSQRIWEVWNRMIKYSTENWYSYCIDDDKTERLTKFGKVPVPKISFGRMDEMFKLIGMTRPSRFIKNRFWENREMPGKKSWIGWATIVNIEELWEQNMVDLQTSTGTYIANGFVSHNTTHLVVDNFDKMVRIPYYYSMFIAHEKKESDQILQNKIPVLWNNFKLKNYLYYKVLHDQAWEFRIWMSPEDESVNSFIRAGTSWVSGTYKFQHLSEFALMEKKEKQRADEVLLGTLSVPLDGSIVIESTARWNYGKFYEMFMKAWEMQQKWMKIWKTEYKAHFYNFLQDPEIQKITKDDCRPIQTMVNSEFFRTRMEQYKMNEQQVNWWYSKFVQLNYDLNLLLQDYPLTVDDAFRGASDSYFNVDRVDLQPTRTPIAVQGGWKFFAVYNKNHKYCMWVDPSGGKWWDNAAAIVIDVTVWEICAEYCNKFTPPAQLADEICDIGRKYWYCLIWVEVNNHWHAVIERMKSKNYPNIYSRFQKNTYDDKETKELWFLTTSSTKPMVLSNLSLAINEFSLLLVSDTIKTEIKRYPRDQVDVAHTDEQVWHFDRVMATAIAWEMRKYVPSSWILTYS